MISPRENSLHLSSHFVCIYNLTVKLDFYVQFNQRKATTVLLLRSRKTPEGQKSIEKTFFFLTNQRQNKQTLRIKMINQHPCLTQSMLLKSRENFKKPKKAQNSML